MKRFSFFTLISFILILAIPLMSEAQKGGNRKEIFRYKSNNKKKEEKIGNGKVEMKDGRPHFVPGKPEEKKSAAPENLPFVDEMISSSNMQEPSDDEVKERLNRLMRGEL